MVKTKVIRQPLPPMHSGHRVVELLTDVLEVYDTSRQPLITTVEHAS